MQDIALIPLEATLVEYNPSKKQGWLKTTSLPCEKVIIDPSCDINFSADMIGSNVYCFVGPKNSSNVVQAIGIAKLDQKNTLISLTTNNMDKLFFEGTIVQVFSTDSIEITCPQFELPLSIKSPKHKLKITDTVRFLILGASHAKVNFVIEKIICKQAFSELELEQIKFILLQHCTQIHQSILLEDLKKKFEQQFNHPFPRVQIGVLEALKPINNFIKSMVDENTKLFLKTKPKPTDIEECTKRIQSLSNGESVVENSIIFGVPFTKLIEPVAMEHSHSVYLIKTQDLCKQACAWIRKCNKIAVDVEFVAQGEVCLIQIGVPPMKDLSQLSLFNCNYPAVFLFDMQCKERDKISTILKDILEDSNISKVFHDARADGEILYREKGILLKGVVDTQVQYKLWRQVTVAGVLRNTAALFNLPNDSERIGLNDLLQEFNLKLNERKKEFRTKVQNDERFWTIRPLTKEAIQYASQDVTQLLAVHAKMEEDIICSCKNWIYPLSSSYLVTFCPELKLEKPMPIGFDSGFNICANMTQTVEFVKEEQLEPLLKTLDCIKGIEKLKHNDKRDQLSEIVLDVERLALARFMDDSEIELSPNEVTDEDLENIQRRISSFGPDNRAGLSKTLHRFSRIVNKRKEMIGLTVRVGRAVSGIGTIFRDILFNKKNSILIIAEPSSGKTTLLRDFSKILANEMNRRVVIVDTSNEIAGDGNGVHASIGKARRLQVPKRDQLHEVMIEAVQNHNPQTVIIDEIANVEEAFAAKSINARGVQLIATAHGSFMALLKHPELNGLIGGLQTVILGDDEAKRRKVGKTVVERKGQPCFNVIVEVLDYNKWRLFTNAAHAVDTILQSRGPPQISHQIRFYDEKHQMFLLHQDVLDNFDSSSLQEVISHVLSSAAK